MNPTLTATPTTATTTPTNIPTTAANGTYTGFWGPFYNGFSAMGAAPTELPILLAVFIIGMCTIIFGLASSLGPLSTGVSFNPLAGEIGMIFGIIVTLAIGIFPAWIVVIGVVGLILYVSIRIYSGGGH